MLKLLLLPSWTPCCVSKFSFVKTWGVPRPSRIQAGIKVWNLIPPVVVHTEPCRSIFLGDQNNDATPGTVKLFYYPHFQHSSQLCLNYFCVQAVYGAVVALLCLRECPHGAVGALCVLAEERTCQQTAAATWQRLLSGLQRDGHPTWGRWIWSDLAPLAPSHLSRGRQTPEKPTPPLFMLWGGWGGKSVWTPLLSHVTS